MGLLYEDLSYVVRSCIYKVHTELGTGFNEESYQLALEEKLRERNIPFRSQEERYVKHRGEKVKKFVLDLIVDDKIILELKAIEAGFHPLHTFQIISYLKCWKKQLGFLVNFGLPSVAIKRNLFTEKTVELVEDYSYIKNLITPALRQPLTNLRTTLLNILEIHGVGYGEKVYRTLLLKELTFNKIEYVEQAIVPVRLRNKVIRNQEIKWPIINNQFICGTAVLKDNIKLDILKMSNYLKAMNLEIGLLAHFGKDTLEIHGIAAKK